MGTTGRPRRLPGLPVLVRLDLSSDEPLYRQIYRDLRVAILTRRLAPGTRLPSTRALARELAVSRNTVLAAFSQLLAEGYVDGRVGSGTRVSAAIPEELLRVGVDARPAGGPSPSGRPSRRGATIAALPLRGSAVRGPTMPRAFRPGTPALDEFPVELWHRLTTRRWRRLPRKLLDYADLGGYRPLREAIALYLGAARGVRCTADQVLIVGGSQHALHLCAQVLLDPGDEVWLEDPGYYGARGALAAGGARLVAVPVDAEGLDVAAGTARAPHARLAYVTPSHQFPLGVTMSLPRRLALLEWAARASAWLLEDDYDSEFRYVSRPLTALHGLDPRGRVIYTGTFSKVLFPALRIGYLVVPESLVDAFIAARHFGDGQGATIEQAILADFILDGHFERHVRRMRRLYRERQETLVDAVGRYLGPALEVRSADAGMHLVGWLPEGVADGAVSARAAAHDVDAMPLSFFALGSPARGGLVLGYANVPPIEIRAAAQRLARAVEETRRARPARGGLLA
jgi:GntR family transcriptional regulator/MocR family aminotransferase